MSSMDNEQRCGTCKWSKLAELEGMIYCAWPVPLWIIRINGEYGNRDKALLYKTDGKDCPTWHAK